MKNKNYDYDDDFEWIEQYDTSEEELRMMEIEEFLKERE